MIDWDRVDELRDEIGFDDFCEVVELFLEEVDEVIERLIIAPDPALYEQDLHFLKGSALNLGFRDFGALCATGERAAAANAGNIDIPAVIECYQSSRSQFLAQIVADQAA